MKANVVFASGVVCALLSQPALADDFDNAANAYGANNCPLALRLTKALAGKGNAKAQSLMGSIYMDGTCVAQDYRAAANWFEMASKQGDATAEYDLAYMYYNPSSYGVKASTTEMVRLYLAAARQGYSPAENWIGTAFLNGGPGLPRDLVRAYMWLTLAARTSNQDDRDLATGNRDTVALTSAQSATALSLVQRCLQTHYADCGDTYGHSAHKSAPIRIALKYDGGTFLIPVRINGAITLDFVLDSGASDVGIPADVVSTLIRTGTISQSDFVSMKTYALADGSTLPSPVFKIKTLKLGTYEAHNVTANVLPMRASPLLGQSFLARIGSWSIDSTTAELVLH